MTAYDATSDRSTDPNPVNRFHPPRKWGRLVIGVIIPLTVAAVSTAASSIRSSWNAKADTAALRAKADTSDIRAIREQLTRIEKQNDDNGERLRQIICGRRVVEGCR